ncbi:imidazolonepropionase [Thaumasiovibrio subtropicus]|uniref:imidazolonepropionase n=1 Tax=Thaumasiovibrio subtropicus TaxID=1891207 RepID=UPI000B359C0D|nr:imidazolonepropionase [Thaumasiovibrio subtropicus]
MDPDADEQGYQVVTDSWLHIADGKVQQIGTSEYAPKVKPGTPCIDAEGKLVTPGLIDAHTHLVFAGCRANEFEQRLNGVPYTEIAKQGGGILASVTATRNATEAELTALAIPRAKALARDGVTSIEIKSGYGLTLNDELKMLRVAKALQQHVHLHITTTLLAAHALPPEFAHSAEEYIEHICDEIIPAAANENLVDAVDVFCEKIAFSPAQMEKVFRTAHAHGLMVKGHTEQLSNLGGSALAAELGATSVDHLEYLDEAGVQALATHGTVATLLPGAFFFLRETQQPPIDLLRQYQVPMAIASDFNPGTSPYASLTLMMNMACTQFRLTPREALQGVTCHAAKALGQTHTGYIAKGMQADLAVWQATSPAQLSYQVGTSPLAFRVIKGVQHHGE